MKLLQNIIDGIIIFRYEILDKLLNILIPTAFIGFFVFAGTIDTTISLHDNILSIIGLFSCGTIFTISEKLYQKLD